MCSVKQEQCVNVNACPLRPAASTCPLTIMVPPILQILFVFELHPIDASDTQNRASICLEFVTHLLHVSNWVSYIDGIAVAMWANNEKRRDPQAWAAPVACWAGCFMATWPVVDAGTKSL